MFPYNFKDMLTSLVDFVNTIIFFPNLSTKYFIDESPNGPFYLLSLNVQFFIVFFLQLYIQSITANSYSMCYKWILSYDQQITKS